MSPLSEALGLSVLRCGHSLLTTRCESRTPWTSFQTDTDPAQVLVDLPFPEPEAEGLGHVNPGCVRDKLHHDGKDQEALLHRPSAQSQKQPAGVSFHSLVFQLMESVK